MAKTVMLQPTATKKTNSLRSYHSMVIPIRDYASRRMPSARRMRL